MSNDADDSIPQPEIMPQPWLTIGLAGWLILCYATSLTGILYGPGEWYAGLRKPSWTPPNAVFGPVWTVLYALMAIAAWRVWRLGGWRENRLSLSFFLTQLLLNALWTPLFFGWQQPGWACMVIAILWLTIAFTRSRFRLRDATAGWLLLPYQLWVLYAASLNYAIWRWNP